MSLSINAETRIGDLLEAHPEAEAALVAMAPAFRALNNPVLRRTVARVATVAQAARVAGIPVPELVAALRRALGDEPACDACAHDDGADGIVAGPAPVWLVEAEPAVKLDAAGLMAAGRTPVGEAAARLAALDAGQVLLLVAPFRPVPLIEALAEGGLEVYARPGEGETWEVWVRRGRERVRLSTGGAVRMS